MFFFSFLPTPLCAQFFYLENSAVGIAKTLLVMMEIFRRLADDKRFFRDAIILVVRSVLYIIDSVILWSTLIPR